MEEFFEKKSASKMQDSREGGRDERELSAVIRERMRESGAIDRISAGVRSGEKESEISKSVRNIHHDLDSKKESSSEL